MEAPGTQTTINLEQLMDQDRESTPPPTGTVLDRGAKQTLESIRSLLLGATAALLITAAGYKSGQISRPQPAPGTQVVARPSSLLAGVERFRGNLARMIALRSASGDEQLGLQEDAFPKTLIGYWTALNHVSNNFYNPTPLSAFSPAGRAILSDPKRLRLQLTYSAIQGVMSSLDDPYTRFLDPAAFKEMQQDNAGSFAGIGAQLIDKAGKIVIVKPLPDTPAADAHILPLDEITAINGRSTEGMDSEMAVKLIRGPAGSPITLTLRRGSKLIVVKLVRAMIRSQHFEYHMIGNLGYMRLMMFDEQAADNIERALSSFKHQGARGLILDLRENPGGLLNAAVDVASKLIPSGTVVWVQERGGQRNSLPTNGDSRTARSLPLVVLVDHYSASASEIVSGAIKDTHSGTLVGLTTWGKGLVQEVIPLSDGSAIALTTAHYYTPSGADINLKGVTPDVIVGRNLEEPDNATEATITSLLKEKDEIDKEQMDTALSILRKRVGVAAISRRGN